MKSEKNKIESHWLSHGRMAESLGISVSAFRQWNVPPVAKIGRQVFYSPGDVIANRLAHEEKRLKKRAESATGQALILRQEKLRLMRAQAENQELKNAELREQLIDVDLLRWTLGQTGKQVAEAIGEIPEALRQKCPKLTAVNHKIIRLEIEKCQTIALQMAANLDFETFKAD